MQLVLETLKDAREAARAIESLLVDPERGGWAAKTRHAEALVAAEALTEALRRLR